MTASPIQWAAVENAIAAWVRAASGVTAIWSAQNKARPAAPYIAMRIRAVKRETDEFVIVEPNPLAYPSRVVGAVIGDALSISSHGLALGDGPVRATTTGALPGGLALATDYWAIPVDSGHLKLAGSFRAARAGSFVALTGAGTGAMSLVGTAATRRAGAEINFVVAGYSILSLSLQCYAAPVTGATGVLGAVQLLDQVIAAHLLPSIRAGLVAGGVAVWSFGAAQALDGIISSTVFEPRAVAEVELLVDSSISETGTIIESVVLEDQSESLDFEVPPE